MTASGATGPCDCIGPSDGDGGRVGGAARRDVRPHGPALRTCSATSSTPTSPRSSGSSWSAIRPTGELCGFSTQMLLDADVDGPADQGAVLRRHDRRPRTLGRPGPGPRLGPARPGADRRPRRCRAVLVPHLERLQDLSLSAALLPRVLSAPPIADAAPAQAVIDALARRSTPTTTTPRPASSGPGRAVPAARRAWPMSRRNGCATRTSVSSTRATPATRAATNCAASRR